MYPLTKIKIAYIDCRIQGFSRSRAYQAASGNPNLRSCENLGSRLEKKDWRIVAGIKAGLEKLQDINLARRIAIHEKQVAQTHKMDELREADRELEAQKERVETEAKPKPRDDSHLDMGGRLPPPHHAPTVQNMALPHTVRTYDATRRIRGFPWSDAFDDCFIARG